MAKTFQIKYSGEAGALVEKARKQAQDSGAQFSGDEKSGTFSGKGVVGRYEVEGDTVSVTIEKKPFPAPWVLVEKKIRGFFS